MKETEIVKAICDDCGWEGHPLDCGSELSCPRCKEPIGSFECREPIQIPDNATGNSP